MEKLSKPDKALISRVMKEVSFKDRIVGYSAHQHVGAMMSTMYSFEEIVNLLNDKFPLLIFEELETWLRTVMKDEELAIKIHEAVEKEKNDQDRTQQIKILMEERLSRCKEANLLSRNVT